MQKRLVVGKRPDRIPLSHAQRRIWVIDRFRGRSAAFTIPLAWRLFGRLDTRVLQQAINDLLKRHESLRTVFAEVDGEPVQRVLHVNDAGSPFSTIEVDLNEIDQAVMSAVGHQFDLYAEVPIRVTALDVRSAHRAPTDVWILVIVVHHVAGDGASIAPLMRDITTAYAARLRDTAPRWAPLPAQYADYTLWQRDMLGDADDPNSRITSQLNYWRHEIAGVPEISSFPTDRPRPENGSHYGDIVEFKIDFIGRLEIEECAQNRSATVSMVLQAALAVLIFECSAREDVVIGGPIAGRTDEALTDLVGFFVNMWVLRVDLSGDPTFGEVIDRVRSKALRAYENQDIPFAQVADLLKVPRSPSHHRIFQIRMAWNDYEDDAPVFPGLDVEDQPIVNSNRIGWYDCFFNMGTNNVNGKRGISGAIHYATSLFDRRTIEDFAYRYVSILRSGVKDPDSAISALFRADSSLAKPHNIMPP